MSARACSALAVGAALADGYGPALLRARPRYYAPVPRCRVEMRWNPNWGGYRPGPCLLLEAT